MRSFRSSGVIRVVPPMNNFSRQGAKTQRNTLGLNTEPVLLYYPPEPSCASDPWCLPPEPPVSFHIDYEFPWLQLLTDKKPLKKTSEFPTLANVKSRC